MAKKFFALLTAAAILLTSCSGENGDDYSDSGSLDNKGGGRGTTGIDSEYEEYDSDDTWAVYWYLCGSDLESENGFASVDLSEMMEVELPDNVQVVIQTGGAYGWDNDFVTANQTCRFLYSGGGLETIEEIPLQNMGEQETLREFLDFCNSEYPADRQAVIIWNHGGGSISGVAFDEVFDWDSLSITDVFGAIYQVFGDSEQDPPLEFVGFDACLMATIDTAYAMYGAAKYMIASEETEPGCGWNYSGFLQALADNPGMDGASLGKVICDTYYDGCVTDESADGVTLSVIDLSRIPALIAAYNNVGVEALAAACEDSSVLTYLGRNADSSMKYGPNDDNNGYTNMVDLGDLVNSCADYLPETAQTLTELLSDCVVYKVNGEYASQSSGLSCYYPLDMDEETFCNYAAIVTNPPYQYLYEYLITGDLSDEGYEYYESMMYEDIPDVEKPAGKSKVSKSETKSVPTIKNSGFDFEDYPVYIDGDGYAVLDLGAEKADILSGVYFELSYYDDDVMLLLGRDNDIDGDWDNGVFKDNFRGVWGAIDGHLAYMELTCDGDGYNLYTVPILLNGKEYSLCVSYKYADDSWEILGARRGLENNGMADKNLIKLKAGDKITTLHYVCDFDGSGEYKQVEADTFTVTAGTKFGEASLGDGEFVLFFEMVDARNNSMYSKAVYITVEGGEIYMGADD